MPADPPDLPDGPTSTDDLSETQQPADLNRVEVAGPGDWRGAIETSDEGAGHALAYAIVIAVTVGVGVAVYLLGVKLRLQPGATLILVLVVCALVAGGGLIYAVMSRRHKP